MRLDATRRAVVERTVREVCHHRHWALLAVSVRTNHVHAVVRADAAPERVMNDLKSYATRRLVEAGLLRRGDKVWTRHGSTRWLDDERSVEAARRYVDEGQGAELS